MICIGTQREKKNKASDFPEGVPVVVNSSSQAQPLLAPLPRCRAIVERVDELYAWEAYQHQYQLVNTTYMTSMDSLLRDMTIQKGLDPWTYPPPSPTNPPPSQFQYAFPTPQPTIAWTRNPTSRGRRGREMMMGSLFHFLNFDFLYFV